MSKLSSNISKVWCNGARDNDTNRVSTDLAMDGFLA